MYRILDEGLDELAYSAHAGFVARNVVSLLGAGIFALILPWPVCLAWVSVCFALEGLAWFATRRQYLRQAVGWRMRLAHVSGLAASSLVWVAMGGLLWLSGSVEGALCAMVLWLTVIFFAQTNAYQSRAGFIVGGAIPATVVLAVVLLAPSPLHIRLLPIAAIFGLALCFAGDGVARMLAARRRLAATQNQLRESEQLWKMLFDLSPLPQVCFDASKIYELLRPSMETGAERLGEILRATGGEVADVVGLLHLTNANRASETLYGVPRFDGAIESRHFDPSFLAGFCDALNDLGPDGAFPPFDAVVVRADGARVEVCVHIRTVPDSERRWSACIATFVDMTEVRRSARDQIEATKAAEAANQAKSEFLATMSHEIRTPLNGVLGLVQVMERDDLSKPQRERLELIGQSGETLLAILNDILDLSKIEAGRLDLETADFDLESLARGAHTAFRPLVDSKGLDFTLEIDPAACGLYRGDPVRVRQLLYNLISNAVKFTSAGYVRVSLNGDAGGGAGIVVTVEDTGMGIDPDQVERLFDKFVQADSSTTRRFGGTGLGLAICRELCLAMGGEISAKSQLGQGSRFTFSLPLPRAAVQATPAAVAADPDFDRRPLRILAAEDNAVNQLVIRTLLGQAGLDPTVVDNGAAAVAAWEGGFWDLILMDVQMPVMDGLAATRQIRQREAQTGRPPTPIIALTANAMHHQTQGYISAGMTAVVAKPIDVSDLFAAMDAAMENEPHSAAI